MMPHIVDPEARPKRDMLPGIVNMTTETGEQREMMDGIIKETRAKVSAPGLPDAAKGKDVPLMKVSPSKTKYNMGMTHIRGTKY
jgi:hypothetical protein